MCVCVRVCAQRENVLTKATWLFFSVYFLEFILFKRKIFVFKSVIVTRNIPTSSFFIVFVVLWCKLPLESLLSLYYFHMWRKTFTTRFRYTKVQTHRDRYVINNYLAFFRPYIHDFIEMKGIWNKKRNEEGGSNITHITISKNYPYQMSLTLKCLLPFYLFLLI